MTQSPANVSLSVRDLSVRVGGGNSSVEIVRGVTFDVAAGETVAIVGESGSGKSMTALAIMRLVGAAQGMQLAGSIELAGVNLLRLSAREMRGIRGSRISMIFQEPMTSLNPVKRVGAQIGEALRAHRRLTSAETRELTLELLRQVRIPAPEDRIDRYPHELSGGMRQRIMIAMALACRPSVLIADEPTTALDVTVQQQILDLMSDIKATTGTSIILITHDLGLVANYADRVAVMYAGRIVETGSVDQIFSDPLHPYSIGLLSSLAPLQGSRERLVPIDGDVPSPDRLPPGCSFHPRCPFRVQRCGQEDQARLVISPGREVACWRAPVSPDLAPQTVE